VAVEALPLFVTTDGLNTLADDMDATDAAEENRREDDDDAPPPPPPPPLLAEEYPVSDV
jgi:hypothetical protein